MKALILVVPLLGCTASNEPKTSNANWKSMSLDQRQATLNAIADECGMARSGMQLRNGDELRFQPDPNSRYESVDCALGKLKGVLGLEKMGFVGNEAYVEEKK
jgi:hypothetical protein